MQLSDMLAALNRYADDIIVSSDAIQWLNAGKDKLAQAANAVFPDISLTDLTSTWVFDAKWQEAPVLYAASHYKSQDSAVAEADKYMAMFNEMKDEFAEKYRVPMRFRDDLTTQQFGNGVTAITPIVPPVVVLPQTYTITKDTFIPYKAQLQIYINDQKLPDSWILDNGDMTFTVNNLYYTILTTDYVTAYWNLVEEQREPPYDWWAIAD